MPERRHRRSRTGSRGGRVRARGCRSLRAVLLGGCRRRGHQRRGRGGRHEVAAAGRGLPAVMVVPQGRVRAEHHRPVALAEAPVRVVRSQYAPERVPELRVENRVDDGVERRVRVAEPREHLPADEKRGG